MMYIPPVRITFPDGSNVSSDHQEDDMDSSLSKVFDREVRLMKASGFEKPSYEEYWPNIDGLAQREKVTDDAMPPQTFFDIAVIHILTTSTILEYLGLQLINITGTFTAKLIVLLEPKVS